MSKKLDYTPIIKETPLEKLARSYEMQTLYNHKILPFRNKERFSYIQLLFLNLLERYHQLLTDIALGEENTEEGMEEDPLRVEGYFLWRNKKIKEQGKKLREEETNLKDKNNKDIDLYKITFE